MWYVLASNHNAHAPTRFASGSAGGWLIKLDDEPEDKQPIDGGPDGIPTPEVITNAPDRASGFEFPVGAFYCDGTGSPRGIYQMYNP